jgi:hypothetical protein
MKIKLEEVMQQLLDAVIDTGMEINFSSDAGVTIYWNGVNRIDCNASSAAKAAVLIKQLEKLGMKDC